MLLLLYVFVGVTSILLYFYLYFFARFSFGKDNTTDSKFPSISVLICAKNEAANLKQYLPHILEQEYPKFQLVLINDAFSIGCLMSAYRAIF